MFGATMAVSSLLTSGVAGADTEIHSGTQYNETGWVQQGFYSGETADGTPDDPVYSWASYVGGVSWQQWNYSGGGSYDKLTQDFWKGLLGTEAGSGAPSGVEQADMYVSGYGVSHWNGGTEVSTPTGDGTCPESADPPFTPCEESQYNANGGAFTDPIVHGYILYGSNYGDPPVSVNGAFPLLVLNGYIS